MSCMATSCVKEPLIDTCNGDMINSDYSKILDLDLVKMDKGDVEFTSEYQLVFNMNDKVHAVVAWFDTDFSDL